MPPFSSKRAFFSLNVDSDADHVYERTVDHRNGKDKVTVRESGEPRVGNTSLNVLTKPFEREIKRSIERVVDGRTVRDTKTTYDDGSERPQRRKTRIEDKYDTSDL
jgi:ribose 5-phosphate isomerase B